MAIRRRKPTSPGRRFQTSHDFSEITTTSPEKSLLAPKHKTGGRNNHGRKTSRHRGGGHKQRYRQIDFKRNKDGVPATVASIEYDPNRTCRIALLHFHDGEKRYILAPSGLNVGDKVSNGPGRRNSLRLRTSYPLHPGRYRYPQRGTCTWRRRQARPQRRHECSARRKEGKFATLRLPSTEMRRVPIDCRATVGVIGNSDHELIKIGKAGRTAGWAFAPRLAAWP